MRSVRLGRSEDFPLRHTNAEWCGRGSGSGRASVERPIMSCTAPFSDALPLRMASTKGWTAAFCFASAMSGKVGRALFGWLEDATNWAGQR